MEKYIEKLESGLKQKKKKGISITVPYKSSTTGNYIFENEELNVPFFIDKYKFDKLIIEKNNLIKKINSYYMKLNHNYYVSKDINIKKLENNLQDININIKKYEDLKNKLLNEANDLEKNKLEIENKLISNYNKSTMTTDEKKKYLQYNNELNLLEINLKKLYNKIKHLIYIENDDKKTNIDNLENFKTEKNDTEKNDTENLK